MSVASSRQHAGKVPVDLPVWIEPAASLAVALILFFPLGRQDLGELAVIFGVFLTIHGLVIRQHLKDDFAAVNRLSQVVDLSRTCDVDRVSEILRLYLSIREPELGPLRDDALDNCTAILRGLQHNKTARLSGGEYNVWLLKMLEMSMPRGRVVAVSVMDESEWLDIPAEREYLDANVAAARSGTSVIRIFLSTRAQLSERQRQEVIRLHDDPLAPTLTGYVAWVDELERRAPDLLNAVGPGFVVFDERVALIDVSIPPGPAEGIVTVNMAQRKKLEGYFEQLLHHSHRATAEFLDSLLAASSDSPQSP